MAKKVVDFDISDNTDIFKNAMDEQVEQVLMALGIAAEGFAKDLCPWDTGRLRNSITHALDGGPAAISQYEDDNGENPGYYHGEMAKEPGSGKRAVYIGTNVEYAPYVEKGHHTKTGTYVAPKPYLKPAIQDNTDKFKEIIENYLHSAP